MLILILRLYPVPQAQFCLDEINLQVDHPGKPLHDRRTLALFIVCTLTACPNPLHLRSQVKNTDMVLYIAMRTDKTCNNGAAAYAAAKQLDQYGRPVAATKSTTR